MKYTFQEMKSGHDAFADYAVSFLERHGFLVQELTYHSCLHEQVSDILRMSDSWTAILMRTRADRIVVHREKACEFFIEFKHPRPSAKDVTVELVPFLNHVKDATIFFARTLYAVYHPAYERHFGWWCHELPAVREVHVPYRWTFADLMVYEAMVRNVLPGVPVTRPCSERGSGDAYAIIPVDSLTDWRDLVLDYLHACEVRNEP